MADEAGPPRPESLPNAFLTGARASALDGRSPPAPENLIAIANDAFLRAQLVQLLDAEAPEFRRIIKEYIDETAGHLDATAETTEVMVELFDRAGLPISTAAFLSGIGLLVSWGFRSAPSPFYWEISLVSGYAGVPCCGSAGISSKASARKLRRLADDLKRQ